MRTKRWFLWAGLCLCLFALFAAGCAPAERRDGPRKRSGRRSLCRYYGRYGPERTAGRESLQRVVVLSTSLLNMADALDGELAGRATVKAEDAELPERYAAVPDVGPVYNVSVEKSWSFSPI